MNERQISRLFPNASRSFIEANTKVCPAEQVEPQGSLDSAPKGEEESMGRVVVRFTCYRVRLLDWDNSAASCKDLLDGLRHSHLIRDDSPKHVNVSVEQVKVNTFHQEKTVIEIVWPET